MTDVRFSFTATAVVSFADEDRPRIPGPYYGGPQIIEVNRLSGSVRVDPVSLEVRDFDVTVSGFIVNKNGEPGLRRVSIRTTGQPEIAEHVAELKASIEAAVLAIKNGRTQ